MRKALAVAALLVVMVAPTAHARSGPTDRVAVVREIHTVFDRFGVLVANQAIKVFGCESRLAPGARSAGNAGLAQLNRRWQEGRVRRLGFRWEQMYEARPNLMVAANLYAEQGWRPWTCRKVLTR